MKIMASLLLLIILISCKDVKPVDKNRDEVNSACDKFMTLYSKGQYDEAVDLLRRYSVLESDRLDTLNVTIKRQADRFLPVYGKVLSSEFIIERKVKDFISKRFYVLKFEKYPMKFDFTLYKGSSGWKIVAFDYDESLIELLF